jgi:glutaconate CoA-transferase, subunit A
MTKTNKIISLIEAVQLVGQGGDTLALGGVTLYRRPMAFILALAANFAETQRPSDLTLLAFTAGVESDILVGSGLIHTLRTCYFGLEAFGLAPYFTQAAAGGNLNIMEETEASLALGLRASMAGVGFLPSTAWQGTDLLALRPDVKTINDPYSGESLTAFPAIECSTAVIHALEADPEGNARIGDNRGVDQELSLVADHVIITAERIVPRLEKADIVGPMVEAVIEAPGGAWPTSCHPLYPLDGEAILDYTECAGTEAYPALFKSWMIRHKLTS